MRVREVIDPRQQYRQPGLAVGPTAAPRHPAESHTVVGALATDQAGACSLAAYAVECHRDLERGVDGLGARVGEECMIESARSDLHQLVRELERGRMCH